MKKLDRKIKKFEENLQEKKRKDDSKALGVIQQLCGENFAIF